MKKEILSEEINSMKYLLGYKRGVVISEQQAPQLGSIQPSNQSTANMFKDSLAAANQMATNNPFEPKTQAPSTQTTAPAVGTPVPATNLSEPDLIKQIQTILNTKFGGKLVVDGKWGNLTQSALEAAIKTLPASPATGTPAVAAPTTGTPAVAAPTTQFKTQTLPDFKGYTPSTPTLQ
jgi:hypothetical protein